MYCGLRMINSAVNRPARRGPSEPVRVDVVILIAVVLLALAPHAFFPLPGAEMAANLAVGFSGSTTIVAMQQTFITRKPAGWLSPASLEASSSSYCREQGKKPSHTPVACI